MSAEDRERVAGLMLVKDEADIIGYSLDWLLSQVDAVFVLDNGSTDGTRDTLRRFQGGQPDRVFVQDDDEVGYWQADKMTRLARHAYLEGYSWGVPVDADEFWRCADPEYRIGDFLNDLHRDFSFASADLYDHKVTALDPLGQPVSDPSRRMGWRFREPGKLPKVAVRLSDTVEIGMGNHDARTVAHGGYVSSTGAPPRHDGFLIVEHYSWRSPEQMVKKIRNGARAYAATTLPEEYGGHWRAFGDPADPTFDDRVIAWFHEWAYTADPHNDPDILFSPFPFPAVR